MTIKAVFFDLDGTLFTGTRGVANSTRRAIEMLHRKGILVGIATGRGAAFALPLLEDLALDFAVTFNGQYIFTPKEIVFANPLDVKILKKIITYAQSNHRDISLGTAHGVDGSRLLKFGETRLAGLLTGVLPKGTSSIARNSFKNVVRRLIPNNDLSEVVHEEIYQVMMVATRSETESLEKEFPEIQVTRSNPYSVDLIPQNIGKLQGIERLGEKFGFTTQEVMCFGDSENDLKMLEGVGIGVAMGNATETVKANANYVTDSNNADGIAKALAYFGLIEFSSTKDFVSKDLNFNKVKAFHKLMDGKTQEIPRAFPAMEAGFRAGFEVEEIVEFLHAASAGNQDKFADLVADLHENIDKAVVKVESKNEAEMDVLTAETDAMIDLLYFAYGNFVLSGIDPYEVFNAVHSANMGKIFPDGKAHFDPVTHKVLKPQDWEEKFAPEKKIKKELDRQIRVANNKNKK
ncbi:HAD-IIB family hydrolase [Lactococcus nasutitermitis]|uniref:HAD-IIB family hydrolase n=1 Tax=Lactococcus nasutitermitis TaxID=1652957 RepID=A0ABV9JB69_9LACT|nr:Cof-type HAD-IIB family hydrolase [Lactococcus nasutitermitis]